MLKRSGVKHVVLNAKYHEKEAEIVAQAGRKGAVTIATNMAGRGTDILLGGNPEFLARDVLRRTRDRSRRRRRRSSGTKRIAKVKPDIDNGTRRSRRCGRLAHHRHRAPRIAAHRQPASRPFRTPGRSRDPRVSIVSLEDDLMRIFAARTNLRTSCNGWAWKKAFPSNRRLVSQANRERAESASKARTSHTANTSSNTTT